jgi:hypothetical protein
MSGEFNTYVRVAHKAGVAVPLFIAGGLAIWCPCERVLECHFWEFLGLLTFAYSVFMLAQFSPSTLPPLPVPPQ